MKIKRLASPWQALEISTTFYTDLLQKLPEQTLKTQPIPGKWSILQVVEHLVGAEESSLQYLQRKQYAALQSKSFLPAGIRAFLLSIALRSPVKFKAPKAIELYPTNTNKPEELLKRWEQVRKEYKVYLEQVPATVEGKPLFRHPRAGALTLAQMLVFMAEHLDHHQRQVKELLAQPGLK